MSLVVVKADGGPEGKIGGGRTGAVLGDPAGGMGVRGRSPCRQRSCRTGSHGTTLQEREKAALASWLEA